MFPFRVILFIVLVLNGVAVFAYNPDHLVKIKNQEFCISCDLSNSDLRNIDLSGKVIRGSNMSGAKLNGANFTGADLNGVNFNGADLSNAILLDADISWSHMNNKTIMCRATMPDGSINMDC